MLNNTTNDKLASQANVSANIVSRDLAHSQQKNFTKTFIDFIEI